MGRFLLTWRRVCLVIGLIMLILSENAFAQTLDSLLVRKSVDTTSTKMNLDAVYNRPFLAVGKLPVSVGGYLEANSLYETTNGKTDGLSFQIPRMTIFLSSNIKQRIKFLAEIEFEEGGKEIGIEFAAMDVSLHPLLNLRGGVIMNPIGAFNQNHDGPKWEFVRRPLSATTIIPSTFSNVGFGLYGKYARNAWVMAYEAYLTNGFDDAIIINNQNRTWLPATKNNPERFTESFNGVPLVTTKFAVRNRLLGELGLSWMGGVYNKFRQDGLILDSRRRVDLIAVDYNKRFTRSGTYITGEYVWGMVDVPSTYGQQFGRALRGGFLDIVQPIYRGSVLGWANSSLNLATRLEYVDYNVGTFQETGTRMYDEVKAITGSISFRPSQQTVIRANYRRQNAVDILGNAPKRTGAIEVGFSTYF